MSFLLDTNICSAAVKNERRVFARFNQYAGRLFTSRIVLAELYAWVYGRSDPQAVLHDLHALLCTVTVLEFDDDCAVRFGRLKTALRAQGITIPPMDLLIASTALVHRLTLVTHNTKDFMHVPGLTVVDWLAP